MVIVVVWALLRRQSETDDMAVINAKRVYRIMRQNALLLERKSTIPLIEAGAYRESGRWRK
jgi:hypothetical protein